jgi:hypothetical protein
VDNFGVGIGANKKFQVNPLVLGLNLIPGGKIVGTASKVGKVVKALTPASTRIAGAAGRIASGARRANAGRADVLNAARGRAAAATDGIRQAAMDSFSDFVKMERRVGTAAAEGYYGVAGRSARNSATDSAGRIADRAGVAENTARLAANRTRNLADYEFAAREVASRLKNVRRIKKLRNKGKNTAK